VDSSLVLENVLSDFCLAISIVNVERNRGSSQHGKAERANTGENCVDRTNLRDVFKLSITSDVKALSPFFFQDLRKENSSV